jgi:hypothetical protein
LEGARHVRRAAAGHACDPRKRIVFALFSLRAEVKKDLGDERQDHAGPSNPFFRCHLNHEFSPRTFANSSAFNASAAEVEIAGAGGAAVRK